ncbi:MAG: GGDEF domain-containing protein [Synergistaceae bacterium]|nr:GGDEF domain-containing protein [Synergistaceae bacterium]
MNSELLPSCFRGCESVAAAALAQDGTILDCNRALQEILKLAEHPIGRPFWEFLFPGQSNPLEGGNSPTREGEYRPLLLRTSDGTPVSLDGCFGQDGETVLFCAPVRPVGEEGMASRMAALAAELAKKNRELEEANAVITRLMNTDPLTGVANRRHFETVAQKALSFSRRQNIPLSLIMADIDHFKQFNDRYGHALGDEVLVAFAQMLFRSCRFEDTVCRYGGEEFLVLLPGTPLVPARAIAERLRENTERIALPGLEEGIRASFGVAEFLADETLEELVERTDKALYKAKSRGRNRVEG